MRYQANLNIRTAFIFFFLSGFPLFIYSSNDSVVYIEGHVKKGDAFLESLKYDSAEFFFGQVLPVLENRGEWDYYCSVANKYTETLWRQGNLYEAEISARNTLEKCFLYLEPDDTETGNCLLNNGIICFLTGSTGMTYEYLKKALFIYEKHYGHWHPQTATAYEWLGTAHESCSDTLISYQYLSESVRIWERTYGDNHPDMGNIYRYLGLYYKRFAKHDSALLCLNKAKILFDKKYGENNYKSVKCLNNICDVYEWWKDYDTALYIYYMALEMINKSEAPNRYIRMMTYFNIGELYQNMSELKTSLEYFQKILPLYFPSFHNENIFSNPESIEDYPYNLIRIILFYKARSLIFLSETDTLNRLDYLESAYECYALADDIVEQMRIRINNYDDLLLHESLHANIMLEMSENALQLYTLTGEMAYFSKALEYMEKNKNMVLFVSGSPAEANKINMPYKTEQTRIRLQNEYNLLKDIISNTDQTENIDSLNNLLSDKKIVLDMFIWKVSQTYPAFKNSIHHCNFNSISQVQKKLKSNQAIIEYAEMCGDWNYTPGKIFAIAITKNKVDYFEINGQEAYKLITGYYNLISNRKNKPEIDSAGFNLYNLLLKPIENLIENKELIIIPSQHISLIAFDALPVSFSEQGKVRYMIEEHTIWETFSVSAFLQENTFPKFADEQVLAMAPGFNKENKTQIAMLTKRDTSLIDLAGAQAECIEISSFFSTKLITGFDATENTFKSLSGYYPVIHLSTHGVPDDSNETMVRLAFSKRNDNKDDGFLNMYEVFNLNLNADMVVLSACKTGIGELNRGEGNLNLAWAFTQAGAKSTVISLWDANDYASSVIMPAFYKYLAGGNTKPEALRKAKLEFIKLSDDLTGNPYFWAGFAYYGDDSKINNTRTGISKAIRYIFIVLILLIALGAFIKWKRV
ncbi:MAG: CHAT domain-containing protein [Bacteroidales bacterium]|nr:CHAT domain-containing protein [Bacteroidales bacterium]